MTDEGSTNSAGFVQILVLVGLVTISVVVTATLVAASTGSGNSSAFERLVREDAVGRSALLRLSTSLSNPGDDLATRALQQATHPTIDIASTAVDLEIASIDGKIDVTRGDRRLLDRYLENAGIAADVREEILRTVDEARIQRDAEAALNALASALLEKVPYAIVEQDFSRFGTMNGVNPQNASGRVLAAIPDLSPGEAAQLANSRQPASQLGVASQYFGSDGRRFELIATIHWSSSEQSRVSLPVELTAGGRLVALAGPS